MSKLFFNNNRDWCHTLEYWKDFMREKNLTEMELWKAKPVYGTLVFYCREFGEFGEKGVSCGKECEGYVPCNGKNGKCKHMGFTYEAMDEKFVLKNVLTGWEFKRRKNEQLHN